MSRSKMVCAPVEGLTPSVDSVKRRCTACSVEVWMDRVNLHVDADIVCGDCALVMMRNDYARGEPMAAAVTRATYETACATYGREKVDQVIANLGIQVDDPPSSQ